MKKLLLVILLVSLLCLACTPTTKTVVEYRDLKPFLTLNQLESWVRSDNTNLHPYIDGEYMCGDFALDLQKAAAEDGYLLNIQIDTEEGHALNSAVIGIWIYFIEPQTDEVWVVGVLLGDNDCLHR